MKKFLHAMLWAASLVACTQAGQQIGAWQIPANGPALAPDAPTQLIGKTCWGTFDKGTNEETARGAVFIRFSASSPTGDFWRKWGRAAQMSPRRDDPDGYDYSGKMTTAQLTPTGTEITFRTSTTGTFNWFIRPSGPGVYAARAMGISDSSRGAVGELHCE